MKRNKNLELEPLGEALMAYWEGDKGSILLQEHKDGRKKSIPVAIFFRGNGNFYPTEEVVAYCRGRVLIVGAGTGVHALELQNQGFDVTAIDVNLQATQIMKERGVKDIRLCDFFEFDNETYDTILMLGHNIGICKTINRLTVLLEKCESLLTSGGQILANSIDESTNCCNTDSNKYPGEQEFRLSFGDKIGPWMRWLHIDYKQFSEIAAKENWSIERLIETNEKEFLARLYK
ncbi:class I SAM-dependent methyltransferase [Desulfogranum japonicum]|uniref:class I SAM-dependent methyltransferase n=1 Tax=Desulfogranum japonicum TaxID=231447 RepID=UPI0003F4CA2C|nr:methyltransferase domain-containing protein [Desulfogranum japonicum]